MTPPSQSNAASQQGPPTLGDQKLRLWDLPSEEGVPISRAAARWVTDLVKVVFRVLDADAADRIRMLVVRSPVGTGKTWWVQKWTYKAALLVVTHLCALVHSLATAWRCVSYDRDGVGKAVDAVVKTEARVCCTVASAQRIAHRKVKGGVFVFEEFTAGLANLAGGLPGQKRWATTNKRRPPRKRREQLAQVLRAIGESRLTVLLDADAEPWHAAMLAGMAGVALDSVLFVDNTYKPPRGPMLEYKSKQQLDKAALNLWKSRPAGDHQHQGEIAYFSTSKRSASAVARRFRDAGARVLLVTSSTRGSPEVQSWLASPQTEEGGIYDVLVCSPSLAAGVDLKELIEGVPMFRDVFVHGHLNRLHPSVLVQMAGRVRGTPAVHWTACFPETGPPPSPVEISDELWAAYRADAQAVLGRIDNTGWPNLLRANFDPLLSLHAKLHHDRLDAYSRGHKALRARFEKAGWSSRWAGDVVITDDDRAEAKGAEAQTKAQAFAAFQSDPVAMSKALKALALDAAPATGTPEHEALRWFVSDGGSSVLPLMESVLAADGAEMALSADAWQYGFRLAGKKWFHVLGLQATPVDVDLVLLKRELVVDLLLAARLTPEDIWSGGATYSRAGLDSYMALAEARRAELREWFRMRPPTSERGVMQSFNKLLKLIGAMAVDAGRLGGVRQKRAVLPQHLEDMLARRYRQRHLEKHSSDGP